jgi:AraC family transcriptional regulator
MRPTAAGRMLAETASLLLDARLVHARLDAGPAKSMLMERAVGAETARRRVAAALLNDYVRRAEAIDFSFLVLVRLGAALVYSIVRLARTRKDKP